MRRSSLLPRRWLRWTASLLLAALACAAIMLSIALQRAAPLLRARIVAELERHFHARVELDSFHVSLLGGLWAEGKGLRIWPPAQVAGVTAPGGAQPGVPLIRIAEFRFHAPLRYQPGVPLHISVVEIKGLEVDVPPRTHFEHPPAGASGEPAKASPELFRFVVDSIRCTGAHLTLESSKAGKLPLEFAIAHLWLTDVSAGGAMRFDAQLTNPRPAGTITTAGNFGPWVISDPGQSALAGSYTFAHADLSGFRGIAGILHSTGSYAGTLRKITVDGVTDTPDFRLTHFGAALPLYTRFHALVDGVNGDTRLEQVEATLGQSHFQTQGSIVRVPGSGHDISLTVNVDRGRIEDFLRLASRTGAPLLSGALTMNTTLEIPPGPAPVHQRMKMNGTFALDDARFTSAKIQDRITELSLRGQGKPGQAKSGAEVRSAMHGSFAMADGVITLPALQYIVPGAQIDLKGTYSIDGGALNFAGTAKMQATVSQMVGGWKGMLLRPADRFFKKDGAGTEVPIHISGTRESPEFGVDFGRIKTTRAQRPGETP